MSEETRRKASDIIQIFFAHQSVDCGPIVDALTAHMRDELAPKPQTEFPAGHCPKCDKVQVAVPVSGPGCCHCPAWVDRFGKQPTPAKCEECSKPSTSPHHYTCSQYSLGETAQPSPTTEAPETNWPKPPETLGVVWSMMQERWVQTRKSGPETIADAEFIRADVVEKRVTEAERAARIQAALTTRNILKADGDEDTQDAARRVVADLEVLRTGYNKLELTLAEAATARDTALARVRELEERVAHWSGRAGTLAAEVVLANERAETAERELAEARAALARHTEVQLFVSSLRDLMKEKP